MNLTPEQQEIVLGQTLAAAQSGGSTTEGTSNLSLPTSSVLPSTEINSPVSPEPATESISNLNSNSSTNTGSNGGLSFNFDFGENEQGGFLNGSVTDAEGNVLFSGEGVLNENGVSGSVTDGTSGETSTTETGGVVDSILNFFSGLF